MDKYPLKVVSKDKFDTLALSPLNASVRNVVGEIFKNDKDNDGFYNICAVLAKWTIDINLCRSACNIWNIDMNKKALDNLIDILMLTSSENNLDVEKRKILLDMSIINFCFCLEIDAPNPSESAKYDCEYHSVSFKLAEELKDVTSPFRSYIDMRVM
ncbi:MAG: hypothetical protein RSB81_02495 [Anaerovoracaceae bacterium]